MRSSRISWKNLRMVKFPKHESFIFLGRMQEGDKGKFVDALEKLEKFKDCIKMTISAWVA